MHRLLAACLRAGQDEKSAAEIRRATRAGATAYAAAMRPDRHPVVSLERPTLETAGARR